MISQKSLILGSFYPDNEIATTTMQVQTIEIIKGL